MRRKPVGTCVVTQLTEDQSRFETPGVVLRGRSLYFARRASPGAHAVITHCDILEDLTLTACTETALEADDAAYAYAPLRFEVADTLVALTTDDEGRARMLSCLLDTNGAPTAQCSVASSDASASAPASNVLVRGGLDENRITTVAGHAARKLKDTADPLSAANRRIEILLAVGE